MDKIQKAIVKPPKNYQADFQFLLIRLLARDFLGLDVAKLKGGSNLYRLKHGRLRIIFTLTAKELRIMQVGLRSDKTYKNL